MSGEAVMDCVTQADMRNYLRCQTNNSILQCCCVSGVFHAIQCVCLSVSSISLWEKDGHKTSTNLYLPWWYCKCDFKKRHITLPVDLCTAVKSTVGHWRAHLSFRKYRPASLSKTRLKDDPNAVLSGHMSHFRFSYSNVKLKCEKVTRGLNPIFGTDIFQQLHSAGGGMCRPQWRKKEVYSWNSFQDACSAL